MSVPLRYPTGDRVVLREFIPSDEDAVHAFCSNPLVTRYTTWGPNTPEDTHAFITEVIIQAETHPRTEYGLAITHANTGRLIGSSAIWITDHENRRGELGYVLDPAFWSQGYATETTRLLLELGFDGLGLHRIAATCHPDNAASARVLEKAGMRFEGRLVGHMLVRGSWRDSLLYAAVNQGATQPDDKPASLSVGIEQG